MYISHTYIFTILFLLFQKDIHFYSLEHSKVLENVSVKHL